MEGMTQNALCFEMAVFILPLPDLSPGAVPRWMLLALMCLAVPRGCCTGQRVAAEGNVTLIGLLAQLCSIRKVGGREGCGSPGPHLIWSQHIRQGRCLDVHSAHLVCMYYLTCPENPGKEFPSDTWLRALTHGLKQAIVG